MRTPCNQPQDTYICPNAVRNRGVPLYIHTVYIDIHTCTYTYQLIVFSLSVNRLVLYILIILYQIFVILQQYLYQSRWAIPIIAFHLYNIYIYICVTCASMHN